MRLCAVSFKECWQDEAGKWVSYGGFPLQMRAIGELFDEMTLLIVRGQPRQGGLPLPEFARIVPLRQPAGEDNRRKLSVLLHLPYYLSTIARYVRQADAVHVPLPGDIPLLAMMVALAMRKRLVARYGGSWAKTSRTTFMNRVTTGCMRRFVGGRNVMLATGEGQTPPLPGMNWIFATALSGSELNQIRPKLERGLADPPRLVYVGRLSPEKGVAHLVEAMALLKAQWFRPLPSITLIGGGPEQKTLETKVKEAGCEQQISFVGQLDRDQLSGQLSQADLCVQPSLTEGFSKAWLDAMAHGLPVLASEVGAARAALGGDGERGWLVPPGDTNALADALQRVLTDPMDWPSLRRRCRAYVEARTLEAWGQQIGEICARQWSLSLVNGRLR